MYTVTSIPQLTEVKEQVDMQLNDYCAARAASAARINKRYELLWQAINNLVKAGGKRLRPYMLITSYGAYSQQPENETIIRAAMAQEFAHLAMLIHDDIIDRDTVRYGIKNIVGQYDDAYREYISDENERVHMSESSAVLAGDVLLSEAYHLMSKVSASPAAISQATSILSTGIFEVIGGELLDTESAFVTDASIDAETIARYKTASYSFISPLTIGATLAGASQNEIHSLKKLAKYLGVGYQLRDDMLGIFGDETKTGKSASSDIREGKRTYMIEQFEVIASPAQKEQFFKIFHNQTATDTQIIEARQLLKDSGTVLKVEEKLNELLNQAETCIQQLDINDTYKNALHELAKNCFQRDI